MLSSNRAVQRQRARQVRAGLRLVAPPPRVERDKRRRPRSQERQAVRREARDPEA